MAVDTSPSLTSSSHTLSAASVPATAAASSKMAPVSIEASGNDLPTVLCESLQPTNRHIFLAPPEDLPIESLAIVKRTLEDFATQIGEQQERRLKEDRKRKRRGGGDGATGEVLKLRKVYTNGFETGQVWQQAKRIISGVLEFSDTVLQDLQDAHQITIRDDDQSSASSAEDEELDENLSMSMEDAEKQDGEGMSLDDLSDEDEFDEHAQEEDEEKSEEDEVEEGEDEDEEEGEEFVQDPHGLNDGFFSIDKFNQQTQWFEEQDAKGDPGTDQASDNEEIDWAADPLAPPKASEKGAKRSEGADPSDDEDDGEDGPTFGDMSLDASEGESDEDDDGDAIMDDGERDADQNNANEIYYKDFFAPPPRKNTGGKPKKSVNFKAQERVEEPAEEDIKRAMDDVRRDLFDDESEEEDESDGLSDVSAGDPKSRRSAYERRQAKLAEEIRRLEAASVAKREWILSGEATAADRPMNSLLEQDLDFEHVGKPVPVITPEVSESIEDLIKRRILAQEFDEVLRRRPDAEGLPDGTRRGMVSTLDDSKSAKGLAELYEEEHVRQANPDTYVSASDEKTQREEREVENMWRDVCSRLDALSSWHYRPKPAAPSLSVVADVATIAIEDAQPATAQGVVTDGSRLAPQEVYRAGGAANGEEPANKGEVVTRGGVPIAREEMSREDRTRRRRRTKERARKAGTTASGGAGSAAAGGKKESAGARMRRETMAELKRGGVKVINRKGEVTDVEGNKAKAAKALTSGGLKL